MHQITGFQVLGPTHENPVGSNGFGPVIKLSKKPNKQKN